MALLFMDSFDHYSTSDLLEKWTALAVSGSGSAASIASTAGRRGSGSFRWVTGTSANASGTLSKTLAPGDATCVAGVAISVPSGVPGSLGAGLLSVWDGGTQQITLRLNVDYTLSVCRGNVTGTVLGTTTVPMPTGGFAHVELKVAIHNTTGTVDLRFNGTSVLALTGQDTQNTTNTQWTAILLGSVGGTNTLSGATKTLDWDDFYVLDGTGPAPWNSLLGDCRADARYPTAAGATTGWTPSAGANWSCVDETAPNDDTDYTETATVGATDTFVTQDAPVAGAVLYGVQHCLALKKTDAGICTVAPVIRAGGTDYPGAALSPATSYAYGLQIAATNPATGAQWTESDFNAAEFGYTRVS
jgi:hypothetical protein